MAFRQFLLILRVRAWIIILTLLLTVSAALAISLLMPKQYSASTAVLIDVKSPDPIAGLLLPGMISPGYMATQLDVINSDRVAQRVVKSLGMDRNAVIRQQWQESTQGQGEITVWLANLLQKNLEVKPSRESSVINIGFRGADPAFAAGVANAFAQAYVDVSLELKVQPAGQSATWFEGQRKSARDQLETALGALSAYQQKTGIVAPDERLDHETAKLNELSTQLTIVQGTTASSKSRNQSASSAETLTEVLQSPLIISLKSDVARLEAKLQESSLNLGENHPQTQRSKSELDSLKAKLASETRAIANSFGTSVQIGKNNEKELLEAMARQKARVLDLNRQRDEISVLKRDVETAKHDFEGVSRRTSLTRLESLSVQTNAVILSPASEPTEASRPRVLLNVLVSIFVGTFLGVGIALVLELANRRLRSPRDLAGMIDLPLLSVIGTSYPALGHNRARA